MRSARLSLLAAALLLGACGREQPPAGAGASASAADAAVVAAQRPYYVLAECVACGGALDAAGGAQDVVADRQLVRVCGDDCRARVAADPAAAIAKRDEALIAAQIDSYPTDLCVVMEESLDVMGEGKRRDFLWGARLVRVCCDTCEEQFREDPATYLARLDEAAKSAPAPRLSERPAN